MLMADDVNYPHCTGCGRVHGSLAEADACDHTEDLPNIVPVMSARLEAEKGENHQRLARAQGRYVDQLKQNGVKTDTESEPKKRKGFLGIYWE